MLAPSIWKELTSVTSLLIRLIRLTEPQLRPIKPCNKHQWDKSWKAENGHGMATLRRPNYCIAWQALCWNLLGSGQRERLCNSWRRDTDHTLQSRGLSWHHLKRLSRNKQNWRDFVSGLYERLQIIRPETLFRQIRALFRLTKVLFRLTVIICD